jgi:hypothetical protein
MGILGSAEVVECSASDLVGQYVGQTGPKTKKLFEKERVSQLLLSKLKNMIECMRIGAHN